MQIRMNNPLKINTKSKSYSLEDSALYKIKSNRGLLSLLSLSHQELKSLLSDDNYNIYQDNTQEKPRLIEHPQRQLERIHTRIASLLCRIKQPEYIHSGIKGKSHLTNARAHVGPAPILTTDIKSFYQATHIHSVFDFFKNSLDCSPDVAKLLSELCTCNGHIPTGSRISMPLAYWANAHMFNELYRYSSERDIVMTVFVDDITFSGNKVTRTFKQNVKKIIEKHNHVMHPTKTVLHKENSLKVITGAVVGSKKLQIRNLHHESIYSELSQWMLIRDEDSKNSNIFTDQIKNRLLGKINSQGQIDNRFKDKARSIKNYQKV